jgi:hypothetical protein
LRKPWLVDVPLSSRQRDLGLIFVMVWMDSFVLLGTRMGWQLGVSRFSLMIIFENPLQRLVENVFSLLIGITKSKGWRPLIYTGFRLIDDV